MKRKRATERVVVGGVGDGQAALDGVRGADAVISAVGGGGETLTTFAETIVAAMRQADDRAVYERLKPGGFYVIVDHAAATGTGTSHAKALHRIEPAAVREGVETAGFVLDAESTMLANKDDPHSIKVFEPSIKGVTDRFA